MHDALSAFDYHTITSLMQTYLLVAAARSIFWQIRYIFSESQQGCVARSFRIDAGKRSTASQPPQARRRNTTPPSFFSHLQLIAVTENPPHPAP